MTPKVGDIVMYQGPKFSKGCPAIVTAVQVDRASRVRCDLTVFSPEQPPVLYIGVQPLAGEGKGWYAREV